VRAKVFLVIILLSAILSACGLFKKAEPTVIPTETPVPTPTLVPTPSLPLAILVLPADLDKETSDSYQKEVYDLAGQSGMRFQVRNSLAPADIEPGLKIVVALPPDPGIAALAAAAPQVQFLAIGIPGISAGGNISTLAAGSQTDIPAFIAGYTAAMISNDFHTGMVLPKDNAAAQSAATAFANGMAYYCGLCQPFYYVADSFPAFLTIPGDEKKTNYLGYVNTLISQYRVDTIYLYPDIEVKELTDQLGTTGGQFIGATLPNPKPAGWVMTISPDQVKAITKAWPNLVAGQGGQNVQSPLGLADVDPGILSPGKQRLVQQVLDGLLSGRIATGTNP
jgi:hypothetical protein